VGLAGCTGTANVFRGQIPLSSIAADVGKPVVAGGPNDLKSKVTVRMVALDGNQGNGFAYMPAVVWLEPGGTVSWEHTAAGDSKRVSHTVTSMSKGNAKPQYCPVGSRPFDSGVIAGLGPWKHEQALRQDLGHHHGGTKGKSGKQGLFHGPYKVSFDPAERPKGVYFYMCEDHMQFGMVGAVVVGDVGPNSPGWSPGMTEPPKKMFVDSFREHFSTIRGHVESQVNGQ